MALAPRRSQADGTLSAMRPQLGRGAGPVTVASEPQAAYVRVCFERGLDEKTGLPFSWCHVLRADTAKRVVRRARRRWPDAKIWLEAER